MNGEKTLNEELWKELLRRLDQVGSAMGSAAGNGWKLLVAKAYIDGYLHIVYALTAVAVVGGAYWLIRQAVKKSRYEDDAIILSIIEDDAIIQSIIPSIVGILAAGAFIYNVTQAIYCFAIPEYVAIQAILETFKK